MRNIRNLFKFPCTNFIKMTMKGISAIIATVLLVAFTVAVAGILSIWSTTLTTTQTQTVSNQTGGVIACTPSLVIDEAKIFTANATVTYHNAGSQPVVGIKVWARNNSGIYSTPLNATLAAGETAVTAALTLSTQDLVRVTGTCASNLAVSADCTPADKCWKAAGT